MQDIRMGYDEEGNSDESRADDPYLFDLDQHGFPVFTEKNLRFVNAMVKNNSAYNFVDDDKLRTMYGGVLASDKESIMQAVYLTDKVNSTHLSVLGLNYSQAVKDRLIKEVAGECKVPDPGNPKKTIKLRNGRFLTARGIIENADRLVDWITSEDDDKNGQAIFEIAHYSENAIKELGLESFSRNNFSFATKFCHHLCVKGGRGDKYCIYDSVIGEVLPYYLWAYSGDSDLEGKSYSDLKEMVSECVDDDKPDKNYKHFRKYYKSAITGIERWRQEQDPKIQGEISYQDVDRLIWYYFKGRRLVHARKQFDDLAE